MSAWHPWARSVSTLVCLHVHGYRAVYWSMGSLLRTQCPRLSQALWRENSVANRYSSLDWTSWLPLSSQKLGLLVCSHSHSCFICAGVLLYREHTPAVVIPPSAPTIFSLHLLKEAYFNFFKHLFVMSESVLITVWQLEENLQKWGLSHHVGSADQV